MRKTAKVPRTTTFTTSPYERAHGRKPRGDGQWAFRQASSDTAYDHEQFGPIVWATGTLAQAKRQAATELESWNGIKPARLAVLS